VLICENAIFSVIAPEGAAAILKRKDVEVVARDLKPTARDLLELGLADAIIPEPPGGTHTDVAAAMRDIGEAVGRSLQELSQQPQVERLAARRRRWREAGNAFLIG
jgi:acetyl-CoA carboxylase alpha subunit